MVKSITTCVLSRGKCLELHIRGVWSTFHTGSHFTWHGVRSFEGSTARFTVKLTPVTQLINFLENVDFHQWPHSQIYHPRVNVYLRVPVDASTPTRHCQAIIRCGEHSSRHVAASLLHRDSVIPTLKCNLAPGCLWVIWFETIRLKLN